MSVADWKPTYQEPEDYGVYLVKVKGKKEAMLAQFDHPNGERQHGWYEVNSRVCISEVTHWDTLPE